MPEHRIDWKKSLAKVQDLLAESQNYLSQLRGRQRLTLELEHNVLHARLLQGQGKARAAYKLLQNSLQTLRENADSISRGWKNNYCQVVAYEMACSALFAYAEELAEGRRHVSWLLQAEAHYAQAKPSSIEASFYLYLKNKVEALKPKDLQWNLNRALGSLIAGPGPLTNFDKKGSLGTELALQRPKKLEAEFRAEEFRYEMIRKAAQKELRRLETVAKTRLEAFLARGEFDLKELVQFFIEVSIAKHLSQHPEDLEKLLSGKKLWEESIVDFKRVAQGKKGDAAIEAIRDYLAVKLSNYDPDFELFLDLFINGKGDCKVNSRVVIAAAIMAEVPLEAQEQLAWMAYEGHDAAVLWNQSTKKHLDLIIGGNKTDQHKAPIYHLAYEYYDFALASLSREKPAYQLVTMISKLLLANANVPDEETTLELSTSTQQGEPSKLGGKAETQADPAKQKSAHMSSIDHEKEGVSPTLTGRKGYFAEPPLGPAKLHLGAYNRPYFGPIWTPKPVDLMNQQLPASSPLTSTQTSDKKSGNGTPSGPTYPNAGGSGRDFEPDNVDKFSLSSVYFKHANLWIQLEPNNFYNMLFPLTPKGIALRDRKVPGYIYFDSEDKIPPEEALPRKAAALQHIFTQTAHSDQLFAIVEDPLNPQWTLEQLANAQNLISLLNSEWNVPSDDTIDKDAYKATLSKHEFAELRRLRQVSKNLVERILKDPVGFFSELSKLSPAQIPLVINIIDKASRPVVCPLNYKGKEFIVPSDILMELLNYNRMEVILALDTEPISPVISLDNFKAPPPADPSSSITPQFDQFILSDKLKDYLTLLINQYSNNNSTLIAMGAWLENNELKDEELPYLLAYLSHVYTRACAASKYTNGEWKDWPLQEEIVTVSHQEIAAWNKKYLNKTIYKPDGVDNLDDRDIHYNIPKSLYERVQKLNVILEVRTKDLLSPS